MQPTLAMAAARAVKIELPSVSLKAVNPSVPTDEKKKEQLLEDLIRMGCRGLLAEPWNLRSAAMAQEFLEHRANQWEKTLRCDPDRWTADVWAEVYGFRKEGPKLAGRTDHWIDGKFRSPINSKDGHAVDDLSLIHISEPTRLG